MRIKVAAISGSLDWSFRQTCSNETFNLETARRYIDEYTRQRLSLIEQAIEMGAEIIVGPEYFNGSEMFIPLPEDKHKIAAKADGDLTRMLSEVSAENGVVHACSCYIDHGDDGVHETAILTDVNGKVSIQPKHPRSIPAPADWPFDVSPAVYDAGPVKVGVTVCSDCTYDPRLPLKMADMGMQVLLLPGCGFAGNLWQHVIVTRARDTQSIVAYADDGRAAIVDAKGQLLVETDKRGEIILADVEILPKKCSPDAE